MPDPRLGMDIEFGNAGEVPTEGTGWFIGFSSWAAGLRQMPQQQATTGLCVKWFAHTPGNPNGEPKPVSEGRTISVVVGEPGEFRIEFSRTAAFLPGDTVVYVLRRVGDFAAWGSGVYHRAFCVRATSLLTVRWQPED